MKVQVQASIIAAGNACPEMGLECGKGTRTSFSASHFACYSPLYPKSRTTLFGRNDYRSTNWEPHSQLVAEPRSKTDHRLLSQLNSGRQEEMNQHFLANSWFTQVHRECFRKVSDTLKAVSRIHVA